MNDSQEKPNNYTDWICRSHEMARDLSRYVIVNVNIKSKNSNFTWTHCEWFKFEMPAYFLYHWLRDVETELNGVSVSLIIKLNNDQAITIYNNSNNSNTLKSLCASHIMEIECIGEK
ncbi:hypothetical protein M9Y10_034388 [Tritrichomonas musculus]|uniref:Uncharacterized protein n=1 Tax=Tritrichomonas musculus TaxID=1915356 RepID=A0ABR2KFI3_9EUKA